MIGVQDQAALDADVEEGQRNAGMLDALWALARRPSVEFESSGHDKGYGDGDAEPAPPPLKRKSRWRKCVVM